MSWLSGQVLVKEHSKKLRKKKIERKKILFQPGCRFLAVHPGMLTSPGSCSSSCETTASLQNSSAEEQERVRGMLLAHFIHPGVSWYGRAPSWFTGAEKGLCDNENDGGASPKHSQILSWAGRSHKVFKNKKGSICFNSCCSLNLSGTLRYWMHILDFSDGLDWYNHKSRFAHCSENISSLFLVALYLPSIPDTYVSENWI